MTRTQIQLPDDVYARARKVCAAREISLAGGSRRGLEYILSVYATESGTGGEWQPPKPRNLGWKGLSHAQVKEQAQMTSAETRLPRRVRKQDCALDRFQSPALRLQHGVSVARGR